MGRLRVTSGFVAVLCFFAGIAFAMACVWHRLSRVDHLEDELTGLFNTGTAINAPPAQLEQFDCHATVHYISGTVKDHLAFNRRLASARELLWPEEK